MNFTLLDLDLTPEHFERAHQAVRILAYLKWEEAGRPFSDGVDFWLAAEREWVERSYVPFRWQELAEDEPTRICTA